MTRLVKQLNDVLPEDAEVVWQLGHTPPIDGMRASRIEKFITPRRADRPDGRCRRCRLPRRRRVRAAGDERRQVARSLVPRRIEHGEHVDEHQEQIAARLGGLGLATAVDAEDLSLDMLETAATRGVASRGVAEPAGAAHSARGLPRPPRPVARIRAGTADRSQCPTSRLTALPREHPLSRWPRSQRQHPPGTDHRRARRRLPGRRAGASVAPRCRARRAVRLRSSRSRSARSGRRSGGRRSAAGTASTSRGSRRCAGRSTAPDASRRCCGARRARCSAPSFASTPTTTSALYDAIRAVSGSSGGRRLEQAPLARVRARGPRATSTCGWSRWCATRERSPTRGRRPTHRPEADGAERIDPGLHDVLGPRRPPGSGSATTPPCRC